MFFDLDKDINHVERNDLILRIINKRSGGYVGILTKSRGTCRAVVR